jgi:hypothetical protein
MCLFGTDFMIPSPMWVEELHSAITENVHQIEIASQEAAETIMTTRLTPRGSKERGGSTEKDGGGGAKDVQCDVVVTARTGITLEGKVTGESPQETTSQLTTLRPGQDTDWWNGKLVPTPRARVEPAHWLSGARTPFTLCHMSTKFPQLGCIRHLSQTFLNSLTTEHVHFIQGSTALKYCSRSTHTSGHPNLSCCKCIMNKDRQFSLLL